MKTVQTQPYRTDWQAMATACLDISMHNKYQQGLYLAGACKWVSKRFGHCLVNIGDTLHRHNLRHLYPSAAQAHSAARSLGDRWLESNRSYLELLEIPYTILRSDDWLADPGFEPVHEALWSFYYEDPEFLPVVKTDIETFVTRRSDLPPAIVRKASLYYLIEETAADILLGQRGGVAHLYPAGRHQCYGHLVQRAADLPPILRGLENSAFKRLSPGKIAITSAEFARPEVHEKRNTAS